MTDCKTNQSQQRGGLDLTRAISLILWSFDWAVLASFDWAILASFDWAVLASFDWAVLASFDWPY